MFTEIKKSEINGSSFEAVDFSVEGGEILREILESPVFAVKSDFSQLIKETVYSSVGRGQRTVKVFYSGDPVLKFDPAHLNDSTMFYPEVGRKVLASPNFPDEISQPEWVEKSGEV